MNHSGFITLTLPIEHAETLRDALQCHIDECGIPMDDETEPAPAIVRAVEAALADVPFIRIVFDDVVPALPDHLPFLYAESNLPMSQFRVFPGMGQDVLTVRDTGRYDLFYGFQRVVAVLGGRS